MEKKLHGFDFRTADNKVLYSFEFEEGQKSHTFTLTGGDAVLCNVYSNGYSFNNSLEVTTTINKLMVNLGEVKEYEEYGAMPSTLYPSVIENCKNSINLKVQNKNIFNKNNFNEINASLATTNGNVVHLANTEKTLYFKCKKNTTYSFQKLIGISYKRFIVAETVALPAVGVEYKNRRDGSANSKLVYTTSNTAEYIAFWYYSTGSDLTKEEILNSIQIEENSEVTDYIEHEEQTVTFPLEQGQLLHKDDYLADDGIHHKRKQIVLKNGVNMPMPGLCFILNAQTDGKYRNIEGICSHFKNAHDETIANNANAEIKLKDNEFNFRNDTVKDRIYFKNSEFTTLEDWQNFFNTNEVMLEYELVDEEIEAYTKEQQEAYNKLKELYSYEEVTHITCEDEVKSNMQLTYFINNEMNKTYAKKFDEISSKQDKDKAEIKTEINELQTSIEEDINEKATQMQTNIENLQNTKQNKIVNTSAQLTVGTYLGEVDINKVERYGNVCKVDFRAKILTNIENNVSFLKLPFKSVPSLTILFRNRRKI